MENDTMANTKKMTKAVAWSIVKGIVEQSGHPQSAELVEKIDNELVLLAKKNSAEKKPTAQQVANASVADAIYEGMVEGTLYSVTDLIKTIPECADLANQRVSAIVRGMIGTKVERIEEKRKAYFRKIAE
jgi:hypothetical protein